MAEITAAAVGKLRQMTNCGMMDCKNALTEADGDMDAAVDILRKKGIAKAAKKAGREANEGVVAQHVLPGARVGVIVEVNCETDFVAKNDDFRAFADNVAKKLAEDPNVDLEEDRTKAVQEVGENIVISRHHRMEVNGNGSVATYIHTGGKIGVLVEVGADKEETVATDDFKQFVRDVTLQIAAASPHVVSRDQVDPQQVEREKEVVKEQMSDKPAQALNKIIEGKLEKFYQGICLLEQGFVKNADQTVKEHIHEVGNKLGDNLEVRRFVRFQVGEES